MSPTATVPRTGDEQLRRFVVRIEIPGGGAGTRPIVAYGVLAVSRSGAAGTSRLDGPRLCTIDHGWAFARG
jgi:hypothetical protein